MASSSLFPHDSGDSFRCSAAGCSITPTPGVMVLKGPSAGTCSIFGLPIAGCSPTLNSEYVGSLRRLISSYVRGISSGHHIHTSRKRTNYARRTYRRSACYFVTRRYANRADTRITITPVISTRRSANKRRIAASPKRNYNARNGTSTEVRAFHRAFFRSHPSSHSDRR